MDQQGDMEADSEMRLPPMQRKNTANRCTANEARGSRGPKGGQEVADRGSGGEYRVQTGEGKRAGGISASERMVPECLGDSGQALPSNDGMSNR